MDTTAEYLASGNCLKFTEVKFKSLQALIDESKQFQCNLESNRAGNGNPSTTTIFLIKNHFIAGSAEKSPATALGQKRKNIFY